MTRVLLDYPHRIGGHCGSGALRDLCEWHELGWGETPDEGLVFALGGDLSFQYARLEDFQPPIYLVGRGGDLEVKMLRHIGAEATLWQTDDADLGWTRVQQQLDAGQPVLAWADIAELPYLNVRLQMSRHDIVIIGYDDELDVVYVVDNDREHVQAVPSQALRRARTSTGFPVPTRSATYDIRWPKALPDVAGVARVVVSDTVAMMTNAASSNDILGNMGLACGGTGRDGLAAFAADIDAWPDVMTEQHLAVSLKVLPAFIEKAGTGGGLFRQLYSEGLRDLARLTRSNGLHLASDIYRNCSATWTQIARSCSDDAQSITVRAQALHRLAAHLVELETEGVEALRDALPV